MNTYTHRITQAHSLHTILSTYLRTDILSLFPYFSVSLLFFLLFIPLIYSLSRIFALFNSWTNNNKICSNDVELIYLKTFVLQWDTLDGSYFSLSKHRICLLDKLFTFISNYWNFCFLSSYSYLFIIWLSGFLIDFSARNGINLSEFNSSKHWFVFTVMQSWMKRVIKHAN